MGCREILEDYNRCKEVNEDLLTKMKKNVKILLFKEQKILREIMDLFKSMLESFIYSWKDILIQVAKSIKHF